MIQHFVEELFDQISFYFLMAFFKFPLSNDHYCLDPHMDSTYNVQYQNNKFAMGLDLLGDPIDRSCLSLLQ